MADWLKKIPRNDINLLAQQDEVKNLNIDYASRSNLPHSLPVIAGVGLGVQSAKMFNRALGDKPRKSFPRTVKLERIGRPVISRSVQVSSSNETTYLPQIEALQKEIVLLTDALKEKDDTILHLREIHKEKTLLYAKDLEQEINHHNITKHQLEENQILVIETERLLEERILHYEKGNQELKDQYEKNITSLQKLSQSEISSKDDKIRKLKQQISDLFKEKSWEHRQQMDELQKELSHLTNEIQSLQMQLKRENAFNKQCDQCIKLMSVVEENQIQIKLKNRTIEELQSTCLRFQKQLQEQEKLQNVLLSKKSRNGK